MLEDPKEIKYPVIIPSTTYVCRKQAATPRIATGAISTRYTVVTEIAWPIPIPVINRATIKLAKLGEQAEMTVPISDKMPPSRIPYFLDMRSDTWPLDKDDTDDESKIEATYIPCCVEDR